MTTLTLADAQAIIERGFQHAHERGLRLSIAIVDVRGEIVAVQRADGAAGFSADVARIKARTAHAFSRPTHVVAAFAERVPNVFDVVAEGLAFTPVTVGGGVPVFRGGVVIGAVGISGATSDEDLACVEDALGAIAHDGA